MSHPRPKGPERRRHPRHVHRIPCRLLLCGSQHDGIVKDISRTGLFVHTHAEASANTPVTVIFPPEHGRSEIRATGRVVRVQKPQGAVAGGIAIDVPLGTLGRLLAEIQYRELVADEKTGAGST